MLRHVTLGNLADVIALIALLGDLGGEPARLTNPRLHAAREIHDLAAGIVVIELAAHAPAGPLEQCRDGVAEGSLAAVANVQRAGRVRRHELHVERRAVADVRLPVVRPR